MWTFLKPLLSFPELIIELIQKKLSSCKDEEKQILPLHRLPEFESN